MSSEVIFSGSFTQDEKDYLNEFSNVIDITFAGQLVKGHENKYKIVTRRGEKRLLRINTTEHYDWLEGDFRMYKYVEAAGINIMKPITMGTFCDGKLSYQIYSWYEGEDLYEALSHSDNKEQYSIGIKAGQLMRELHCLPPMNTPEPWEIHFGRKVNNVIDFVNENPGISRYGKELSDYLSENSDIIKNRPLTFTHGDWNPENLMYTDNGDIGIIDLSGENDYGDPWWEFRDVRSDGTISPEFYTGQFLGYFQGEPPIDFFKLVSYYIAYGALENSMYRDEGDINDSTAAVMKWFDGMRNFVPQWYKPNFNGCKC